MNTSFATLLDGFMGRMGYTAGQLSALTKISKRTLANWREGRVSRPREWREIVRVAAALHLSEREASELLEAAGHDPIATLRASATAPSDRALLATWPDEVEAPFQAIADLPYFVGRSTLIESLRDVLLNGHGARWRSPKPSRRWPYRPLKK